jgi:hypothetical protein
MPVHDPATAPRRHDGGYKGDAWSVSIPPDGEEQLLLLDTGLDSVAIKRIPDSAWDRGVEPLIVHAHDGYDETILIPQGSGTLFHGPDARRIARSRFAGPVVIACPAGSWHHILMDRGVTAQGTSFYTVPGTVIAPFAVQMGSVTRDRVSFADVSVVDPLPVGATRVTTRSAPTTPTRARHVEALPDGVSDVRVIPYEAPHGGYACPLDTGHDSLFIMASHDAPDLPGPPFEAPEILDLHRHADVDEYIIRPGGAGWIVNGPSPERVTLTPFRGPCLLVMPAGALHRVLQAEEAVGDGVLIYADRRAVVERYEVIMARTSVAAFADTSDVGEDA